MQEIYSWNEIDFDQHIFFNLSHEINELIEPLREHFGLDSFNYHNNIDFKSGNYVSSKTNIRGFR